MLALLASLVLLLPSHPPASNAAPADWVKVTSGRGMDVYVDRANVGRLGSTRTVTVRNQFGAPHVMQPTGEQFDRAEARVRFNCASKTYHVVTVTWFHGTRPIKTTPTTHEDEQRPIANTVWDRLTTYACGL